jgi:hypothetical protein
MNRRFELWVLQGGYHPLIEELIHLLRCAPNERARVQQCIELVLDRVKINILPNAFNEVIFFSELFNLVRGFMRKYLGCAFSFQLGRGRKVDIAP